MKNSLLIILMIFIVGCGGSSTEAYTDSAAAIIDTNVTSNTPTEQTLELRHKYSYVKFIEDGSKVAGMLELYGTNDYTQAVTLNGFTQTGRGTFFINDGNLTLNRTSGIAIDGNLVITKGSDNKIWLTLNNGVTYVEDDDSYYLKNMVVTPHFENYVEKEDAMTNENGDIVENLPDLITYEGTMTDNQSGISQDYTLYIKSDFSCASIGGGPYNRIEDQRDGSYMWLDGTIIGMCFKPMNDKCIVYGSDGSYFCTLYRK